jgi:hypothetical protein
MGRNDFRIEEKTRQTSFDDLFVDEPFHESKMGLRVLMYFDWGSGIPYMSRFLCRRMSTQQRAVLETDVELQ